MCIFDCIIIAVVLLCYSLLESMPKDRKKIAWEEAFNAALHWNVVSI